MLRQQFAQAKTNGRLPIQLKKTHCELAEKHPFFETLQSCVRSTATLSHRFKSSPAIPGNLVVFNATGYMMMAGHFSENYVSSGDLNRPRESRGSQPFGVLLVLFVQAKRIKPFPRREFRGSANLDSAHPNNNFALTKLNPFGTFRGFANLDSARRNGGFAEAKLNPFAALSP